MPDASKYTVATLKYNIGGANMQAFDLKLPEKSIISSTINSNI